MGQLISTSPVGNLSFILPQRYQMQLAALLPSSWRNSNAIESQSKVNFDLQDLPPELALAILSYLNPTDLYLASGVWWDLASSEYLWRGLCRTYWPFCSAYENWHEKSGFSFRILFLRLDEARLTFNSDAFEGMRYLFKNEILKNDVKHIALYLHVTPGLKSEQKRRFLEENLEVLDALVSMKDFRGIFLPNALRELCAELLSPIDTSRDFVLRLLERFSAQFVHCNGNIGLRSDVVYVLCISLLMLSKDFASPQIKNKMSKREFIRNTRQAVPSIDIELLGRLYDNVYVEGDIGTWVTVKSGTSESPLIQRQVIESRPTPRPYRIIASS